MCYGKTKPRGIEMAKLIVEVDLTFNTDALLVDEDFSEVHLDYDAGRSKFESTDYQELEFELISTHPEAEAAFLFKPKDGDKASVFKVQYNSDAPGLFVELKGTFSVNLRSGVDQLLKEYQDSLDHVTLGQKFGLMILGKRSIQVGRSSI